MKGIHRARDTYRGRKLFTLNGCVPGEYQGFQQEKNVRVKLQDRMFLGRLRVSADWDGSAWMIIMSGFGC